MKIDRIKEMQPWFHGEYRIIMENGKELTLSRNYRANFQGAVGNISSPKAKKHKNTHHLEPEGFASVSVTSVRFAALCAFLRLNTAPSQILAVPSQT